jgi:hypothetical protein
MGTSSGCYRRCKGSLLADRQLRPPRTPAVTYLDGSYSVPLPCDRGAGDGSADIKLHLPFLYGVKSGFCAGRLSPRHSAAMPMEDKPTDG